MAGPVQVVVFEPKDGLRYGHRFWSDGATGLLLKARVLNERGEPIEQFAFTDLTINARIERAMVEPSWPVVPPDWKVLESAAGDVVLAGHRLDGRADAAGIREDHGRLPQAARTPRARRASRLFRRPRLRSACSSSRSRRRRRPPGFLQKGGLNVYSVKQDDHLITVMGETPGATVRQIAHSVTRR